MKAIEVFSSAIGYLKDHLLMDCKKQMTCIKDSDILWVLTVPAIWNDKSKQFMREAAEQVYFLMFITFGVLFSIIWYFFLFVSLKTYIMSLFSKSELRL